MANDIGTTILAATQGMTAFWQFMPRITDVRKADLDDPDVRGDVRYGEMAAVGVTMGTGVILGTITKSRAPVLVAMLVCAGFVFLYETALRKHRPMDSATLFSFTRKVVNNAE